MKIVAGALLAASLLAGAAFGQTRAVLPDGAEIEHVRVHPLYAAPYSCAEHWAGQLPTVGDALGTDCYVTGPVETPDGGMVFRPYRTDGLTNEDWFSWGEPVLAPFDAEIERVMENETVNRPGHVGRPPAGMILLRRGDGLMMVYAHIAEPRVTAGETVRAGDVLAVVGNNGFGRSPHIHLGAWRGNTPVQIIWDQRAMGALMSDMP